MPRKSAPSTGSTVSRRPNPIRRARRSQVQDSSVISAVDLFCGAGGLTRGLLDAGIPVVAGYDIDERCRFPYEFNNRPAKFCNKCVRELGRTEILSQYAKGSVRVLVGCAPCVTFSKYTQGRDHSANPKWSLLEQFSRLVRETQPDIVSMENVPELQRHTVFDAFLRVLRREGYFFNPDPTGRVVYCPDYGIAQQRTRLVLLASRIGPIDLIDRTHSPNRYRTVADVLSTLPPLAAGQVCPRDPLHRASRLSKLNARRIRRSVPGGTWRDWPDALVAQCHVAQSGRTYSGVYGRMVWNEPSPTITTQFYGFGNGRFGHPAQDRALSLREGAMLQSFPKSYAFVEPGDECHFKSIGRMIGNAVPVRLGEVIGRSIKRHLVQNGK